MVRKIFLFVSSFGREIAGLHEAAYLLALSSGVSLLFALIRDRLLAHTLGAGSSLDLYFAAFRIPDFIYVTAASLVSTSILVPFLMESREKGDFELKNSIQNLFGAFFTLIVVVSAIAWIFMEPIEKMLFPSLFSLGLGETLVSTSRILLLSPVLLGFSSFLASLIHINNRFLIYAASLPLYNTGIIVGIIFLLPDFGVQGLAWGVILGAVLLVLCQAPFVARDDLLPRPSFFFNWRKVKRVVMLAIPRTITLSSQQLSTLALVAFASFLGAGSISVFNLAFNLQSVPLSLIGASYASAAFPVLSKLIAQNDRPAFFQKMISAINHILFWVMPLSVLFIVLRAQIVRTVLGSGAFSWSDTKLTAAALALFVISSGAQCLTLLFVRSFYAEGKTGKPLLLNVVSMFATIVLAFVLLKLYFAAPSFASFIGSLLKTEGASDPSVLMLPLAFSLGMLLNLYLHFRGFSRDFPDSKRSVSRSAFQTISSSIIGGYAAYLSLRLFDNIFDLETLVGVFLQGLGAGIVGAAVIILVLNRLGSSELSAVIQTLKEKVWKIDRRSMDQTPM